VSDTGQGDGWWVASNGQWYPVVEPSGCPRSGRIGSSPILGNAVIARRSAGSIDVTVSFVTLP